MRFSRIVLCFLLAVFLLGGCAPSGNNPSATPPGSTAPASSGSVAATPPGAASAVPATGSGLEVHFLDVGQADCIFIRQNGATMLIDAGNNADGPAVVRYLRDQGVIKLDTVIGTHPHEDHIGGLDEVILEFGAGSIIMPKVEHTTKTYEDLLDAISQKGLRVTAPVPGMLLSVGDAQCTVLAPNSKTYDDLNNYSVVVRVTYGDTAFLLTGDAESLSEKEMMKNGLPLKADVLKVGHHGSSSSSSAAFLRAVSPSVAVISVGKDNDYGHPSPQTVKRLKDVGSAVYQTCETGTIIAKSDGKTIKLEQEKTE